MIKHLPGRDDFSLSRLFFQLYSVGGLSVYWWQMVKPNVIFLMTNVGTKVVKGYQSQYKMNAQLALSFHFKSRGFSSFSSFEPFPSGAGVISAEGMFWGIMPYVDRLHSERFHFKSLENRKAASDLLETFHQYAKHVEDNVVRLLPYFSLYSKWETRYEEFLSNRRLMERLTDDHTTSELLRLGSSFFTYIDQKELEMLEKKAKKKGTVIHGDCASHNFIRKPSGELVLIDFDLCSNAPHAYEFLQFANRIMPVVKWSLNHLGEYEPLRPLLKERWFITSLLFPADLFRDWNKLLKRKAASKQRLEKLKRHTKQELQRRILFFQEVKSNLF